MSGRPNSKYVNLYSSLKTVELSEPGDYRLKPLMNGSDWLNGATPQAVCIFTRILIVGFICCAVLYWYRPIYYSARACKEAHDLFGPVSFL